MRTALFYDLDDTLWEKQAWGGVPSLENLKALQELGKNVLTCPATGRPRQMVHTSFLRAGCDKKKPWYEMDTCEIAMATEMLKTGIYEEGLIVTLNRKKLYDATDQLTEGYRTIMVKAFSEEAITFFESRGIRLILDGVVTQEKTGPTIRNAITGALQEKIPSDGKTVIFRQQNESAKLTYKPPFGIEYVRRPVRTTDKAYATIVEFLNKILSSWKTEARIDLPLDAYDIYPCRLAGISAEEIFRKAEAVLLIIQQEGIDKAVYAGDGINDARAMQELLNKFEGGLLLVAPHNSHTSILEIMQQRRRENSYCYHLEEDVSLDNIIPEIARLMRKHEFI